MILRHYNFVIINIKLKILFANLILKIQIKIVTIYK